MAQVERNYQHFSTIRGIRDRFVNPDSGILDRVELIGDLGGTVASLEGFVTKNWPVFWTGLIVLASTIGIGVVRRAINRFRVGQSSRKRK